MTKTATRVLAEKIQEKTGLSLVKIHFAAHQLIEMGLATDRHEALTQILEWL